MPYSTWTALRVGIYGGVKDIQSELSCLKGVTLPNTASIALS